MIESSKDDPSKCSKYWLAFWPKSCHAKMRGSLKSSIETVTMCCDLYVKVTDFHHGMRVRPTMSLFHVLHAVRLLCKCICVWLV